MTSAPTFTGIRIFTIEDKDNILAEDLSNLKTEPEEVSHLTKPLRDLCENIKALGLAANQLGMRQNFFFVAGKAGISGVGGELCINPTWRPHPRSTEYTRFGEGCLSIPGEVYAVSRHDVILATWVNSCGHVRKDVKLKGLAAQVYQHESDHLRGVLLSGKGCKLVC